MVYKNYEFTTVAHLEFSSFFLFFFPNETTDTLEVSTTQIFKKQICSLFKNEKKSG